jgi:hypothetical protein
MHNSKLPLMYWFTAIHLLTSTRKTFSYKTLLHKLRSKLSVFCMTFYDPMVSLRPQ